MTNNKFFVPAVLAVLVTLLAGCAMVSTSPARSVSVNGTGPVPVVYSLTPTNTVVSTSVDRIKEGTVLSVKLDEYELPTSWAKLTGASNDQLYNQGVTNTDATTFVFFGGAYYAKNIQLGTGTTDVRNLVASTTGGTLVYTYTDNTVATNSLTLPSASLSAANQKWYWDQMTAGNYLVLNSAQTEFGGPGAIDYTQKAPSTVAFSGATKANRWLKSANDTLWKNGRDAAIAFLVGKNLIGAESLSLTASSGTWVLGADDTGVPAAWAFDIYFRILMNTFNSAGVGPGTPPDVTTSAS